jgi:hypothetical protein
MPIRLDLYVDHILDNLNLPEEILVFSFILIEKYLNNALVCSFNVHYLVFTSISVALKFVIGSWVANKDLEKVGSLKYGSLVTMENDLLNYFTWKLKFFRYPQVLDFLKTFRIQVKGLESDENHSDGEEVIEIEEISLAELSELEFFFR